MTSSSNTFLAERWIARILRGGIVLSVMFIVAGLFLMTIQDSSNIPPTVHPSLSDLLLTASTPSGLASALMVIGLVLLMFTPFLRVLAAVLAFSVEREWKYVVAALLVLLMLIGEMVFAFR